MMVQEPNIQGIHVGSIFKNLRDLIRYTGLTGMGGNSKIASIRLLQNYLSWEKINGTNKIRITEIKQR